jgi:polyhydroxyalkanoate synthesis regulator phasin
MKNSKKMTLIFIVSVSVIIFIAGCSARRIGQNNITNLQTGTTKEVSTLYQNTLKSLVANGTITQAQSDKVLAEVTNRNNGTTNQNSTINQTNNRTTVPNQTNNAVTAPDLSENGTVNRQQANNVAGTGTGTRVGTETGIGTGTGAVNDGVNNMMIRNDLSRLVNNGTITQAQANTINQKVEAAMRNNQAK